jgi:hypothetical protein
VKKTAPALLLIDEDIAAKLIERAGDESRVSQYLAVLLQYAEQQDLTREALAEPIKRINELIEKQADYQLEIHALHQCLQQVIANNQELLATLQLLTGASPWQTHHTSFEQHIH